MKKETIKLYSSIVTIVLVSSSISLAEDLHRSQRTKRISLKSSDLEQLVKAKIVVPSHSNELFYFNSAEAFKAVSSINDPSAIRFLNWLILLIGDDVKIKIKSVDDMVLSSQDHGINQ